MFGLMVLFVGLWVLAVRWLGLKSIYLLLLTFLLSACQNKEEKRQARLEELLSCKPEIPLSKGELYERAMQDYWKQQMKWVWEADKYLIEKQEEEGYGGLSWLSPPVDKKVATKKCGLTWTWLGKPDKITKDSCYPRKITKAKYHTFDDLAYSSEHPEKTFEEFMKNRGARFYHPESDPPIYTAEYYNKPVDFSIVDSAPGRYNVYPKDCCTLMTYQEGKALEEEVKVLREKYNGQWSADIWTHNLDVFEKYKNKNYYLMIKNFRWSPNERGYSITYYSHPISYCGQLLY